MTDKEREILFRQWVDDYYQYAFHISVRILGDENESRDVVQDAFVKVWIKMEEYRKQEKFTTWFYRIVVNLCLDKLRQKQRRQQYSEQYKLNQKEMLLGKEMPDYAEEAYIIKTISTHLTDKQKTVFVLRDIEDLEVDEVCRITGMLPDQVKANLYYARKNIRLMLEKLNIWR